ncbi:MAG: transposase [Deltaproteobacteria bacterium]|nr:transposase [Deltaproteobacteria bacterium]
MSFPVPEIRRPTVDGTRVAVSESVSYLFLYASIIRRSLAAFFRSRNDQAIVELALRQQLAIYTVKRPRPRLTRADRAFWVLLSRVWPRWREALFIVQPETVVRWHRKGFRLYWRSISKRGPGRPRISLELQALIRRFATENDWRARKIQAELEKLGFTVSLATVSRYLPKRAPNERQQQRRVTFLRNHRDVITAMDFLVVPTFHFKLLYVWFVIEHGQRRILHFNTTPHPTSAWTIQQLRETFPEEHSHRFLIHDNDSIFSDRVLDATKLFGIEYKRTAYRSPWQNGTAERWIGSVRRELLDHVIVLDERHLHRLLHEYVEYYNAERIHTRLRDSGRSTESRPPSRARVTGLPRVGGLHRRYVWKEAV